MTAVLCGLIVGVLASEIFLRLPILDRIEALSAGARRALAVIRSPSISDHWKEKAVLAYALRSAGLSLAIGGLILVIALACAVPVMAIDAFGGKAAAFLLSPVGLGVTAASSVVYALARTRLV